MKNFKMKNFKMRNYKIKNYNMKQRTSTSQDEEIKNSENHFGYLIPLNITLEILAFIHTRLQAK